MPQTIIYDINSDALGDNIACIPALLNHNINSIKYVKSKYINIFKLFGFKDPDEEKLSTYAIKIFPDNFNLSKKWFKFVNTNHLCSVAQLVLNTDIKLEMPTIPSPTQKTKEVIISATTYDIVRFIPPVVIASLCKEIKKMGYVPVLVGNTQNRDLFAYEYKVKDAVDLINKTSIMETLEIINRAELVITPDSGLMWLTFLTNTKLIASFFNIDPVLRIIKRKAKTTIIEPNCSCRYCFSRNYIFNNLPVCTIKNKGHSRWGFYKAALWECHKSISYKEYLRALKGMLNEKI